MVVGRRSQHANLSHSKRDLEMEKIRLPNDAWECYLKTWDRRNSKSFQGHFHLNPTRGAYYSALYSKIIKLNPSRKTEVSKSAWIKPCTDRIYYNVIQNTTCSFIRSWIDFEKYPWQSPVFVKFHVSSREIPLKTGLHHGCFLEHFEKLFDKLLFTIPVKTHIQRYLWVYEKI